MITAQRLKSLFDYDEEAGIFTRKIKQPGHSIGAVAGADCHGYWVICIDGKHYLAHRLAWLYVYGKWPESQIDHVNRQKSDNRIANLRLATSFQNSANTTAKRNNKCGLKGVRKREGRWEARIRVFGRNIHLGRFDTSEEASLAYQNVARSHHGEYAA
jgi:hypothetical protein